MRDAGEELVEPGELWPAAECSNSSIASQQISKCGWFPIDSAQDFLVQSYVALEDVSEGYVRTTAALKHGRLAKLLVVASKSPWPEHVARTLAKIRHWRERQDRMQVGHL